MTHTVESIKARLKELKLSDIMFAGKEIKALPDILKPNEEIMAATKGIYEKRMGFLCATANRIIFIDKGLFSLKVEEFSLKSVSSISTESGMLMGKIKIFASGNNAEITDAPKEDAKRFVAEIRRMMDERDSPSAAPAIKDQPAAETDIYEQIEKLAGLKEKGIITEQEFQAKKTKLLNL